MGFGRFRKRLTGWLPYLKDVIRGESIKGKSLIQPVAGYRPARAAIRSRWATATVVARCGVILRRRGMRTSLHESLGSDISARFIRILLVIIVGTD